MAKSDTTTHLRSWRLNAPELAFILLVPLLVVSQWLTLTIAPLARPVFNLALLGLSTWILIRRRHELRDSRRLWITAGAVLAAVLLSIAWNGVDDVSVIAFGSFPYVFPLIAGIAGFIWRPGSRAVSLAIRVAAVTMGVLVAAALIQLAFGEPGFRVTGQALDYPRWWERGRATGLVANPTTLAQLGLLAVALAPVAGRWFWPMAIGGSVAAAASGGRVVIVAVAVLMFVAIVAKGWNGRRELAIGAGLTAALFIVVSLVGPNAGNDLVRRIDNSIDPAEVDVRVENLQASLSLIEAEPILGAGPGRFGSTTAFADESELHTQYGLLDVRSEEFAERLRQAGDDREIDVGTAQLDIGVMQIATEIGILGLLLTGLFAFSLVRAAHGASSLAAMSVLWLIAVFTVSGPGWVDASMTGTLLLWAGGIVGSES